MKFRNYLTSLVVACLAMPLIQAGAQDTAVQEKVDYKTVVSDYIKATGGEAAHRNIKSISAKGTIAIPAAGLEGDVEMSQTEKKSYMKVTMAAIGEQLVGHDGETVWQLSQMTGPEILEGERREQILLQMALSPMMDIEKRYDTIECTGEEEFAGEPCYVVKMQKGDSEPLYNYFSVESKFLVGNKMTTSDPMMGKMEIVSKQSDYKEVAGVLMSHSTTVELPTGVQMITELTDIDINGKVDEKLFELPEDIQKLKKESAGDSDK